MKNLLKKARFAAAAILFTALPANAFAYNLFVDKNNTSGLEDGSQASPFDTIGEAIAAAALLDENSRDIFIANGTYEEDVELVEKVSLTGESRGGVIITDSGTVIKMAHSTKLKKLTVSGGTIGINIPKDSKATITDVAVKKAKKVGIQAEKGSTSDRYRVTVEDSKITDGKGKGFYILKGRVSLKNNEIEDNDEEGVDIRAGVKGTISKNTIASNGESGIELVLGKTSLKIQKNKIKNNDASGITNQFYKDDKKLGNVLISKNNVRSNDSYGINCATPSGGSPGSEYWKKSITLSGNLFFGNEKPIAGRCKIEVAVK